MTARIIEERDIAVWWEMREALFPEEEAEDLHESPLAYAGVDQVAFVWEQPDGALGGFAEASIRRHADGCRSSPIGYLEAWYVTPELRGSGVGRALVEATEEWVRSKGCTEMGSDAYVANDLGRAAHASVGFREVNTVVNFAKVIGPAVEVDEVPADAKVTLRDIDEDNVRTVVGLQVALHQEGFVAPNGLSLAQAYTTTKVWTRAIYADETPVGFVMLSDDDEQPRYYLWRFMIDHHHQGIGFGRAAMDLTEAYVRTRPGGDKVFLSYVPAPGGPEGFYKSLGYEDTGRVYGGEHEAVKQLED